MKVRSRARNIAIGLIAALAACEASVITIEGGKLASVAISPGPVVLEVDGTVQLEATLIDEDGQVVNGRSIFWSSEDPDVAQVSSSGLVTGMRPGTTRVAASSEGLSAITTVTVLQPAVVSVLVTPPHSEILVGETVQLTVEARDRNQRLLEGRPVEWKTSNAAVATVDGSGLVTARGVGTATIIGTVEGVSDESTITVSLPGVETIELTPPSAEVQVGSSLQFTAIARDAKGVVLTDRPVAWTSSDPAVLSVSSNGLAVGVRPGTAAVIATIEGRSAQANVTVVPVPVARIDVFPDRAEMLVGSTRASSPPSRVTPPAAPWIAFRPGRAIHLP